MKLNNLLILGLLISSVAHGRREIREVSTNDRSIKPIFLALGRSTILKFREKPTNVVVGNKNYYNIEYINNDLTIQPLGAVDTNLFVYTASKRTYALLLKIVHPNQYDDIVHVRWKSPFALVLKKRKVQKLSGKQFRPVVLEFKSGLIIVVERFSSLMKEKSYLVQFTIINNSKQEINTGDIKISLTRNNKRLPNQKLLFLNDSLKSNQKTRARSFLGLKIKKGFSINVKFRKEMKKTIISRKYL
jgi:hypothetical protein